MVLKLSIHFVFGSQLTCNRMRRRCKHFTMVDGFGGEMSYMKAVIHMFFNISILKNLRNFYKHHFYRAPPGNCFLNFKYAAFNRLIYPQKNSLLESFVTFFKAWQIGVKISLVQPLFIKNTYVSLLAG